MVFLYIIITQINVTYSDCVKSSISSIKVRGVTFQLMSYSLSNGLCGYDSILFAMYGYNRYLRQSLSIRSDVIKLSRKCLYQIMKYYHPADFPQLYHNHDAKLYDRYLLDNLRPNAWIDALQLKGMSVLYDKDIWVYRKENIRHVPPALSSITPRVIDASYDISQSVVLLLTGDETNGHYQPFFCVSDGNDVSSFNGLLDCHFHIGEVEAQFFTRHPEMPFDEDQLNEISHWKSKIINDTMQELNHYVESGISNNNMNKNDNETDPKSDQDTILSKFNDLQSALLASCAASTEIKVLCPMKIDQTINVDIIVDLKDHNLYQQHQNHQICVILKGISIDIPMKILNELISDKISRQIDSPQTFVTAESLVMPHIFSLDKQINEDYLPNKFKLNTTYKNIEPSDLTLRQMMCSSYGYIAYFSKGCLRLHQKQNDFIGDDYSNAILSKPENILWSIGMPHPQPPTTNELHKLFSDYIKEDPHKASEIRTFINNPRYKDRKPLSFDLCVKLGVFCCLNYFRKGKGKYFESWFEMIKYVSKDISSWSSRCTLFFMNYVSTVKKYRGKYGTLMSDDDELAVSKVLHSFRKTVDDHWVNNHGDSFTFDTIDRYHVSYIEQYMDSIFTFYYEALIEIGIREIKLFTKLHGEKQKPLRHTEQKIDNVSKTKVVITDDMLDID